MKTAGEPRESTARPGLSRPPAPADGRAIRLHGGSHPDVPGLDTALSRALLLHVDAGAEPETLRLHRPGDVVAFGRRDVADSRYPAAVAAARAAGFGAVERLAGGRAAVFHAGTVAFSWAVPDPDPRARTRERYEEMAGIVVAALQSLGADARIGELPGEYCPGRYSVHVNGVKVMGVGQRLARHAAHVGGVIVVTDAARLRAALVPVYEALGLDWDPATAGALEQAVPGVGIADVIGAVQARFSLRYRLEPGPVSAATTALARELLADQLPSLGRAAR